MKKLISLIKACMTDNMSLFKLKKKKTNKSSGKGVVILIAALVFFYVWSFANTIMESLIEVHLEFVLLTLFVLITTILTIMEGIYKSGSLLFNCKDDDLLLSLPIKKSTVLFIRVFKFYVFELLYNSLFLAPAIIVYATKVEVTWTYYLVSIIALLLLPIVPIVISCILGGFISRTSSKFKLKNVAQIVITMIFLVIVLYFSFSLQGMIENIGDNAFNINNTVTKIYYPAGAYIKLVTEFNVIDLLVFILINIAIFTASVLIFGNIYFKINSKTKEIKKKSNNSSEYKVKVNKPMAALIKKELNRFANTPVFVINAAFGLVLFLLVCIFASIKLDGITEVLSQNEIEITAKQIISYAPLVLLGLICFTSLMSSITSSMISLEGKSFEILKSLPVKPYTIIISKVLTAILIMMPFILVGDLIFIIRFGLNIFEILMVLAASFVLPLVSEVFGIIVNIKNPKMDAENDTEVVKQSTSTMIAVLVGMLAIGISVGFIVGLPMSGISVDLSMLIVLVIYSIILMGLFIYLNKKSVKDFEKINV